MLIAREIMNTNVVHLERGISMAAAAQIMVERHVGSIIITASSYPIGILTENDITRIISMNLDPTTTKVEDFMSSPLFSTTPDTDMTQIANTMTVNRIKKMPVLEHQRCIGIITQTDIIKHILRVCSQIHDEYTKGKMSSMDFATCSSELYGTFKNSFDAAKHWHMLCKQCGNKFLDEEREGKLVIESCPKCHGQLEYDPTPPI